jgi:maltose O-acetyltransferase
MRTVREKMGTGEEWGPETPGIDEFNIINRKCAALLMRYNTTVLTTEERRELLSEIIGSSVDENTKIVPPMQCDVGFNIKLGKGDLINYNCVFLDCAEIRIGDHVLIGPGTNIVTADHPFDHEKRRDWVTSSRPVIIEDDVWIGAGAIIISGVTIGARSIVGAGSVVTRDVPPDSIVAGNPAKVIRKL